MGKKILIVDDEERIVKSITGVLDDEGFDLTTAKSGEEALEIFQQEVPLLTLLDIWMPGMDGIEVLKRMKGIEPNCPVIMLSGHATISTAMAAVKLGAFDFIEKPLSLDVLLKDSPSGHSQSEGGLGDPQISPGRRGRNSPDRKMEILRRVPRGHHRASPFFGSGS